MLEILDKKEAEELLRRAIKEIKIDGFTNLDIVANKHKKDNKTYIVEVGIRTKNITGNVPSNNGLIQVKYNDELLRLINTYKKIS